jgi:hypothetical protein
MNNQRQKKKLKRPSVIETATPEEIDAIFQVIRTACGNKSEEISNVLTANDIAEASIKVGVTVDLELAEAMIEYVNSEVSTTAHPEDCITKDQFIALLGKLGAK